MKDTYFDLLCDKIEKEYNEYIAELKKGSIEDLLYRCYEKVIKDEIVDIFCEEELTEDEAHKLYNQPNSLDYIFNEWVSNGVGIRARLIDCIHDCTDDIVLFITDDHAKAKSEGKETEWFDSLRYNAHCAILLENEISRHYDYETSHMDAEGVIMICFMCAIRSDCLIFLLHRCISEIMTVDLTIALKNGLIKSWKVFPIGSKISREII